MSTTLPTTIAEQKIRAIFSNIGQLDTLITSKGDATTITQPSNVVIIDESKHGENKYGINKRIHLDIDISNNLVVKETNI